MRLVLAQVAAVQIGLALFMVFAPRAFFDTLGPFGPYNHHYVQDSAAFEGTIGVAAVLGLLRPAWRVPVLAVTGVHFALHAVSHWIDLTEAHNTWSGPFDAFALTAAAVGIAGLLRLATGPRRRDGAAPVARAGPERPADG